MDPVAAGDLYAMGDSSTFDHRVIPHFNRYLLDLDLAKTLYPSRFRAPGKSALAHDSAIVRFCVSMIRTCSDWVQINHAAFATALYSSIPTPVLYNRRWTSSHS
jgi:hypothetical protein